MDININGNPGTGNTFQEIHIGTVQNYNPNATTVINNNYGERHKPMPDKPMDDAERENRKAAILEYVARIKTFVDKEWKNRYDTLWKNILALPEVEAEAYEPGRQKNTTFNRNLVANIICMMCAEGVIGERNATTLTIALESDKDHSVRAQLGCNPADADIRDRVGKLLTMNT